MLTPLNHSSLSLEIKRQHSGSFRTWVIWVISGIIRSPYSACPLCVWKWKNSRQHCLSSFIASLPHSWIGEESGWVHGSQEEAASLSIQILPSISNKAHFFFCIIKYFFFDQRWEALVHSNSLACSGRLSEMQTLSLVAILKKKEALKLITSVWVKSINSTILELTKCHLFLFLLYQHYYEHLLSTYTTASGLRKYLL